MKRIFLAFIIYFHVDYAQIYQQKLPYSFRNNIQLETKTYLLQGDMSGLLNNKKVDTLNDEMTIVEDTDIGKIFPVNISPDYHGKWTKLNGGDSIWSLRIHSTFGKYMMLIFEDFYIPPGAELFIYPDTLYAKRQILGAITSENNTLSRKFSTPPIKTNSLIIEYYQPANIKSKYKLNLEAVGIIGEIGINNNKVGGFGGSGACMKNVMCPEYEQWCNQRRSVVLIIRVIKNIGRIRWCSGSLITNERRDGKPYLLTAFHCIDNDVIVFGGSGPGGLPGDGFISQTEKDELQNWIFIFNYQSPKCTNPGLDPLTIFPIGVDWISGASYINGSPKTDYAILQLNRRPPAHYNVYYNGWTNDKKDMTKNGVCIHHPAGDVKKISEWQKVGKRKHYWKVKWIDGSTQDGSSGAPMFTNTGYLIGQNSRTNDNSTVCDDGLRNFFGRFDKSWHKYGLSWVLNPNGIHSGIHKKYIISMSGDETCKADWYFPYGNDLHTSDNVSFFNPNSIGTRMYDGVYNAQNTIIAEQVTIQSNTSVKFIAGKSVTLKPGFHAKEGSYFVAKIGTCLQGCDNGYKTGNVAINTNEKSNEMQIFDSNTNISSFEKDNEKIIHIFPNPNSGKFKLKVLEQQQNIIKVEIINSIGNVVYQNTDLDIKNEQIIDLSNFPKGLYLIIITSDQRILTKKIIIK